MAKDFRQIEWDAAVEEDCRQIVRLAVREDLDRQFDWTTVCLVPQEAEASAAVVSRSAGIACGLRAASLAVAEMDARLAWRPAIDDGAAIEPGQTLATLSGPARSMLTAERILLNLIGRLSGISTLARRYVDSIAGTQAAIYDTRKTTPGWRLLEKYAVRCGGGRNHRAGLFDAILIKDNHLALAASVGAGMTPAAAVTQAKGLVELNAKNPQAPAMLVEVEVDTLQQLQEVLAVRPDIVLLDNFALDDLRAAVALRNAAAPDVQLEASGGVNLQSVRAIAQTGVDRISVGALTHGAVSLDIGLDWQQVLPG